MLRRAPSLTDQVKAHIKDLILQRQFADGRVPPEMELAELLGVSRTTVREALSRLEMEGTISRRQGSGTFVNDPVLQIRSRLDEIWSYEEVLRAHGFTPSTRVLETEIMTVGDPRLPQDIAAELGLADDEQILYSSKLFLEDEVPVILAHNFLPLRLITDPYTPEDLGRPVYDFLETFSHRRLAYYLSEITPIIPSSIVTETLLINPETPLIAFNEIGYAEDNEPILKAVSYFRDDLLRFRIIRRRVQS